MKLLNALKNLSLAALIVAAASTVLTSCNDSGNDDYTYTVSALVTYEQTSSAINPTTGALDYSSTFTFYGPGNSTSSTLIAPAAIPSSILTPGQRCVITFTPRDYNNPTATGTIELVGSPMAVPTSTATTAPAQQAQQANAPINIIYINGSPSLTLTGPYINLEAQMPIAADRTFSIVADESTLSNPMPDLYLTTATTSTPAANTAAVLASVNIGSIINRPGVEGVKLHVNNSNMVYQYQTTFELKK